MLYNASYICSFMKAVMALGPRTVQLDTMSEEEKTLCDFLEKEIDGALALFMPDKSLRVYIEFVSEKEKSHLAPRNAVIVFAPAESEKLFTRLVKTHLVSRYMRTDPAWEHVVAARTYCGNCRQTSRKYINHHFIEFFVPRIDVRE